MFFAFGSLGTATAEVRNRVAKYLAPSDELYEEAQQQATTMAPADGGVKGRWTGFLWLGFLLE